MLVSFSNLCVCSSDCRPYWFRVSQATTGRVCTASPAALKWLKREQLLKLLKLRTRQSSCNGDYCVQRWQTAVFQTRRATQRVSARRRSGIAYTHFATVLCGPAAHRTPRNDRQAPPAGGGARFRRRARGRHKAQQPLGAASAAGARAGGARPKKGQPALRHGAVEPQDRREAPHGRGRAARRPHQ